MSLRSLITDLKEDTKKKFGGVDTAGSLSNKFWQSKAANNLASWQKLFEENRGREFVSSFKRTPTNNRQRLGNSLIDIAGNMTAMGTEGGYQLAKGLKVKDPNLVGKGLVKSGSAILTARGAGMPLRAATYSALPGAISGVGNYLKTKDSDKAINAGIGGAIDFLPKALPMTAIGSITNPLIEGIGVGKNFAGRNLLKAGPNILEGIAMDKATGMKTTPQSMLIDAVAPAVFDLGGMTFKSANDARIKAKYKIDETLGTGARKNGKYASLDQLLGKKKGKGGKGQVAGIMYGVQPYQDENGNWKVRFNKERALIGLGLSMGGTKALKNLDSKSLGDNTGKNELEDILKAQEIKANKAHVKGGDLLEEARKYKSAEEFVKAQGETFYYGGGSEIKKIDGRKISRGGELGEGFYFTGNKDKANLYGGVITDLNVELKNPLIITKDELWKSGGLMDKYNKNPKYNQELIKQGYDGVLVKEGGKIDQGIAFYPSQIKTKSQLIDIWNQANKAGGGVRVSKDAVKNKFIEDVDAIYTKDNIPPELLEIKINGKWQPLKPQVKPSIVLDKDIQLLKGVGGDAPNINRMAWGEHYTDDVALAKEYGTVIQGETLKKGTKVANLDYYKNKYATSQQLSDPKEITQKLIDEGYQYARGTLPTGQVEYVKLQGARTGWKVEPDWMPGEPIATKGKYAVLDEVDDTGNATGRYVLAKENEGIIGKPFKTIIDAQKYLDNMKSQVDKVKNAGYDGIIIKTRKGFEHAIPFENSIISKKSELGGIRPKEYITKAGKNIPESKGDMGAGKNEFEDILKAQEIKANKADSDLLSEAKKYKSADEFIKAQGTPVYHGGAGVDELSKSVKILSPEDKLKYPSSGGGYIGLSTSPDKSYAQQYSRQIAGRDDVAELFIQPNAKIKNIKGAIDDMSADELEKLSKKFDVLKSVEDNEFRILNENIIKTKSQLTDIYNQANKAGGGVKAQELDLGSQKVGKTQSTLQPQQEIVSTKSLEFPYKDIIPQQKLLPVIPQQKLLPAGQPKVYTPNQAKAIFKRGGKVVPYKKTLKSGDSVINIPVGGWTGKKPYIEGKPITEVEAHQISQWEKEIGTKAYKKGIVSENFPSKALSTDNVNDKAALSYQRETIKRNVEETFGRGTKETDSVNKYFVEPITKNETERVWFVNKWKKDLTSKFKNLGIIKRGSAEDMAAADFIEGNITKEGLLTKFKGNTKKVDNIIKAAEIGRQEYRKLLKSINDTITLYGYKPIAEKQNYVTHTKQISELTNKFGSLINIPKDKLPTEMSAIHMDTKPGRQFFKFGQHRVGGSTHEGLITALDSYIEPASKQIYHTGDIQRGRALIDYMSKSSNGDTKLSNFNSYLSQYVDSLAGKKNVIDRPFEKVFGRRILDVGDWARRRTGANMVGANVTSALTNYIPFTQSIATTSKPAVVKGLFEGLQSPFKAVDDIDGIKSEYLARNFLGKETLFPKFGESAVKKANILFDIVDKFTKRSVIAGKYFENISKGLSPEDAMKVADDYGARVLVDRSYGQTPIIFGSKTLGMFTQFQTEVNNQMSFLLKDVPKNFKYNKAQVASSLAQFAILSYVFNNLYEKVTGRRPQIDVIHLVESYAQGLEEGKEPAEMLNPTDSNTPVGEFVSNLPFNPAGGRLPIGAAIPNVLDVASGKSTIGAELKKPLYYLAPPVGGGQLKKTIEGVTAGSQGYSATKSGDMRYLIPENRKLQTAIFGQYSTPEARNYFESGGRPLSEKQTSYVKQAGDRGTAYQQIMNTREVNAKETKIKDKLKKSGGTEETENKIFYFDGEDVKSVKKKIALPKLTSNNELNKQILSDYKSDLTDYANYIVYQYESGAITEEKAGDELEKIVAYKKVATDITKAPKKAKKVNLAAISQKILKPVKVEVNTPKLNTFDILSGYSKIKAPTIEAPNLEVGVPKFDLPELTLPNFRKEL